MELHQAIARGFHSSSSPTCAPKTIRTNLGRRITRCGIERWPVKIFNDKDMNLVKQETVFSDVRTLVSFRRHGRKYPYDRRIAPEELSIYRIRAKLLRRKEEQDSDVHLVVGDMTDTSITMIVEIPAPECAEGTQYRAQFQGARVSAQELRIGDEIEITGVGFFDSLHSQSGVAANGFELHPVLTIAIIR